MQSHKNINEAFFNLISEYIIANKSKTSKLIRYKLPNELKKEIDFPITDNGISNNELLHLIQQYLNFSVNTGNPQFFNQLYSGFNFPAFMGEVITALTNTSMYTYEVAPVATLIENEMIKKMCQITGFTNGDGLFVTGGSNANLIAMFSARNKAIPQIKAKGMYKIAPLSAFISDQAHYSFENNANLLGIGAQQVYKIKSDSKGRMNPSDLEKKIIESKKKGEIPFFIAATAATTMLGAFDPIEEINKIGTKHNIWVHVDGSFGGSLILSKKVEKLFKGIENVNSFAWNPHKLMNIPLISSVILVNEKNRLYRNLTTVNDDYIFHETETGSCDLGKKSIQCGRKVDALKLWLAWKYYGNTGYEKRMDNLLELAEYFEYKIKSLPKFELLIERQTLTVCFRYISKTTNAHNEFNAQIRESLRIKGKSLVNYGYINKQFAFRWVVANPETTKADIDTFLHNFVESAIELENKKLNKNTKHEYKQNISIKN